MNSGNEIDIYSLAFGGKGVGKVDGKVCFVEGALPGERVIFRVLKEHARYIEGQLLENLTVSNDRITPLCPFYGKCGGCQLQHLGYSKELYYKAGQVLELLSRIAGVEKIDFRGMESSDSDYGYRDTIELHQAGKGSYGFYKKKTRKILSVNNCPVAGKAVNEGITFVNKTCGASEVTIKADNGGRFWLSDRSGDRFFKDKYRSKELFFSPKAFSQANRYIAEKISSELDEWIGPDTEDKVFFDAYCGVGFFTFLSERIFKHCIGIDESRVAIECAKTTNKISDKINICKFYKGNVEEDFFDLFDRFSSGRDIIFLDPPRKGAGKYFLERLGNMNRVASIYYLSCDPSRLARDAGIITSSSDFTLTRIKSFDMFPRTMHIETLAEFKRGN